MNRLLPCDVSEAIPDKVVTMDGLTTAARAKRKAYLNIVLPLFIISIIAYMDRVNLSYAKLTMNEDLGFTEQMYGLGAGIFFVGYFLFEVPGALIAERFSPKLWLARIMITWGIASGLMAFMTTAWQFYVLRFLLGVAEASLYPVLYASCIPRWFSSKDRPRAIAVMLTSLQVSRIIGASAGGLAARRAALPVPRLARPVHPRSDSRNHLRLRACVLDGRLAEERQVADGR